MSFDVTTLHRGHDARFYVTENGKEVEVPEMFSPEEWDDPRAFAMAGIRGYDPMTAKELETEEAQDKCLNDPSYVVEEKFDGTRALVYFLSQQDYTTKKEMGFCRVFSRRISKKTGFYVENTDSLPQIRELDVPELSGTVLDGEMFIDGKPFKEVSSTLNCSWFNALDRQIDKGFVTFHAFDILFYKGIDLRRMPLHRRKVYLHLAIEEAGCEYIKEVMYHLCGKSFDMTLSEAISSRNLTSEGVESLYLFVQDHRGSFPELFSYLSKETTTFTPRAYYELVVASGGEGVMVKPKDGKYLHKRGWEYSKIKAFLTRDLIVMGFSEPTREYTGKDVRRWAYWVEKATNKRVTGNFYGNPDYLPVTRHYYYNQVGNLLLGVLISMKDYEKIAPAKRGSAYPPSAFNLSELDGTDLLLMEVCETSGFDDDTRAMFTKNRERMVGTVVEVKANGLFHDSGKFRHPRYLRMRPDKSPGQCTWNDHVGASEVTV